MLTFDECRRAAEVILYPNSYVPGSEKIDPERVELEALRLFDAQAPDVFALRFGLTTVERFERERGLGPVYNGRHDKLDEPTEAAGHAHGDAAGEVVEPSTTDKHLMPFVVEPGITWDKILVTFANQEMIQAWANKVDLGTRDCKQAGFPGLGNNPSELWLTLYGMATNSGGLSWEKVDPKDHYKIKTRMTEIRKKLHALFPGVDGNPVPFSRRDGVYKTAFHLSAREDI